MEAESLAGMMGESLILKFGSNSTTRLEFIKSQALNYIT